MRRSFAPAVLLAALAVPFAAAPAGAFPLTNCTLSLTSLGADGSELDGVQSSADDSTQADPFQVDWDGTVAYDATTGSQVLTDMSWHLEVFGIPTPLRGGGPNSAGTTAATGSLPVGTNLPFRVTGLYYVAGGASGTGGSCEGNGWIRLSGDPVGTVPFFGGLALLLIGLLLLFAGYGGNLIAALLGGLLIGLGGTVSLILFALLPLGSNTPAVYVIGGLVLGFAIWWLGRPRRRASF